MVVNAKKCLRFSFINNFFQSICYQFDMFFLKTTELHGIFTEKFSDYFNDLLIPDDLIPCFSVCFRG